MGLWNLIYNFYLNYIFGGVVWNAEGNIQVNPSAFGGVLGNAIFYNTSEVNLSVFGVDLSLGNYFSLIATIITMILILLIIGHFIKKTFNLFGRII